MIRILGIESSCDETAAAVVQDGRTVLSNVVSSQIDRHRAFGGVVPEIASRLHVEQIGLVAQQALTEAGITLEQIDAVGVTFAPGLVGPLLVGVNFAKGLCLGADKPLVPVHHIQGHVAANYITYAELEPPFLCLVVSGGHTHIVEALSYTAFRVVGRTRDDAAGEAFDKAARALGLPYPGGPELEKLAAQGDPGAVRLPVPQIPDFDFSFSGLKTAVVNTVHNAGQAGREIPGADIAAAFCHTVCDILTDKLFAAARQLGYKKIAVAGGVSANGFLRRALHERARREKSELYMPDLSLCGDNAAMIAAQGYYLYGAGVRAGFDLNACPTFSIDEPFEAQAPA